MATAEIQPSGFIRNNRASTDNFKTSHKNYLGELTPYLNAGGITIGRLIPIIGGVIQQFNTHPVAINYQKFNIISHLSGCADYSFWDLSKDIYNNWRNRPFPPIEIKKEIEGQKFNFIYDPRKYNPLLFRNNIARLRLMFDERELSFNENDYSKLNLAEKNFLVQNKMAYWIKNRFMSMAGFQIMQSLEKNQIMDLRDNRVAQTLAMLNNEQNRYNLKPSEVASIIGTGYSHQQYTSDRDTAFCLQTNTLPNQLEDFTATNCISGNNICPLVNRCGAIALDKIRRNRAIDALETSRIQGTNKAQNLEY
jgi:hypothetical protein